MNKGLLIHKILYIFIEQDYIEYINWQHSQINMRDISIYFHVS